MTQSLGSQAAAGSANAWAVTLFWMTTGLMASLAGLLMLVWARRATDRAPVASDSGRAELAELDRLREGGLLDDEAWASARAEAGRRLLGAGAAAAPKPASARDRRLVLIGVVLTAGAALGVYALTGSMGAPDAPYRQRVDQWATNLETLEAPQLAAVAAGVVEDNPNDRQALTMLGAARFEAGDPIGAASAFRRALAIDDSDPQSWARLGEALVRSQDGVVGVDSEAAFREALNRDPGQLAARYFLGEAALARGDAAETRALWEPLIAALDPADPRRADLVARLPAGTR